MEQFGLLHLGSADEQLSQKPVGTAHNLISLMRCLIDSGVLELHD
jgi:hypothetical protein